MAGVYKLALCHNAEVAQIVLPGCDLENRGASRTDLTTEFRFVSPGGATRLIQYFSYNNPHGIVPLITTCPPATFRGNLVGATEHTTQKTNNHKNKHLTAGWMALAGRIAVDAPFDATHDAGRLDGVANGNSS